MSEQTVPSNNPFVPSTKPKEVEDLEKAYNDIESYMRISLEAKWDGKHSVTVVGLLNFLNGAISQIRKQYQEHPWVQEQAKKSQSQPKPEAPVNG